MCGLGFDLGSCWPPHTAHYVDTTRVVGRDLQTLGSQPVMPKNLPDHWLARQAWRQAGQGGRHALHGFRWALGWLGPDSVNYQQVFPSSFKMEFSTPRHLASSLIPACVVSGGILGQLEAPVRTACRSCGMGLKHDTHNPHDNSS